MKKITLLLSIVVFTTIIASPVNAASVLKVTKFQYDAPGNDNSNKNAEYVVIKNTSGKTLNLHNWKVSDKGNKNKLTIEKLKLKKNESVTIYTGKGTDKLAGSKKKVYWNSRTAVWNNDSDELILKDNRGKQKLKHSYTKKKKSTPAIAQGVIKKSSSGICHAPGTTYYSRTTSYTPYLSIGACLKSGGRLPLK